MPIPLIALAAAPLVKYAIDLVPELLGAVAGDKTGQIAERVIGVVKAATGAADKTEAQNIAAADPVVMIQMRLGLAQIAKEVAIAERQAEIQMQANALMDVERARQMTLTFATQKNPLAWGAAVITLLILGGYAWLNYLILNHHVSSESMTLVLGMQKHMETLSTAAVFYWVGSSRGSAAKDEAQRRSDAVRDTPPPALVPRPDATADELMAPSNSRVWRPTR
ncbi:hypothetical protein [Muricoccus vinaceus]|uniref:Uncharacterized protein n=1 Tax=Muricoccus vinaceus TaxID=424704 RepID=A0ABV6INH4_9PROT